MLCLSFPLKQGSNRDEEDSPLGLIAGLSLKGIKSLADVRIKVIPWCCTLSTHTLQSFTRNEAYES